MDSIQIYGGIPLQGQVKIQGSKNTALPILAATILIDGSSLIENCPKIADVFQMQTILKSIGCKTTWEGSSLRVDASGVSRCRVPADAVRGMRSSISLLGALLARTGEAVLDYPGGCVIGERPIDIHLDALKKMGVIFKEGEEILYATADRLVGETLNLKFPSVGATENILLAAVLAEGETWIHNAAKEPEIVGLCEFLKGAGAWIDGIGTDVLHIKGVERLEESVFRVPADRIVAGTYLAGCMIAGGSVLLQDAPCDQMEAVLGVARQMGALCQESIEGLYIQSLEPPIAIEKLETAIYPGFPTDMQSLFLAVMTLADGQSILTEKIFENRFRIVEPLKKMGADIEIEGQNAIVHGVSRLQGMEVRAEELRGGAALIMAALGAGGHTRVTGCHYVYRGYENIGKDLRELGARVYSV